MEITKTIKKVEVITTKDEPRFTISDLTQRDINIMYALVGVTNADLRAKLISEPFNGDWSTTLFYKLDAVKTCPIPTGWELRKL